MGLLGRIWKAAKAVTQAVTDAFVAPQRPAVGPDPRRYLAGVAPGLWSSNHLNEASQCKGWQFVAVRALSRMCSQAELAVHEIGSTKKRLREAKRALKFARMTADKARTRYWRRQVKRLNARLQAKRKAPQSSTTTSGATQDSAVGPNDPLLKLMQRVNPEWSLETFLFAGVQQLSLTGSCMVWCVRNSLSEPAELYVLPTGLLQSRLPTPNFPLGSHYLSPLSSFGLAPSGGDGWAQGTLGQALLTGCEIDNRDIKAIRWPHPVHLTDGLSPLTAISVWVDVANQMELSNWYGLQNTERPGMVFEIDPEVGIDPEGAAMTQFREDLGAEHSGTPNTGKHLVLPAGIKGDQRSKSPVEMDFAVSRPQYRDMNLAAHGVSPIACGITEAGSFSALYAALKQTSMLSAAPILRLFAGELTELLGEAFEGPRRKVILTAPAVDDPQQLEQRLRTDILAGNAVRVNEYRQVRGLEPLPDDLGLQFVGQRTTVRAVDDDPEKPGVQSDGGAKDGKDDADSTATDHDTGTRREDRDRVPGRQDGNGKSKKPAGVKAKTIPGGNGSRLQPADFEPRAERRQLASVNGYASGNGKATTTLTKDFDEGKHPRDESGRFGPSGGGAATKPDDEGDGTDTEPFEWDGEIDADRVDADDNYARHANHIASWNLNSGPGENYGNEVYLQSGTYDPNPEDSDTDLVDVYRWISVDADSGEEGKSGDWTTDKQEAYRDGERFAERSHEDPVEVEDEEEDEWDDQDDPSKDSPTDGNVKFDGNRKKIETRWDEMCSASYAKDADKLVGAPEGSKVTLELNQNGTISLSVKHSKIEDMERTLGTDSEGKDFCHNDLFVIKEKYQGEGLGSSVFAAQVEACAENDIDYIETHAARSDDPDPKKGYNGYYTWPSFGYDETLESIGRYNPTLVSKINQAFPDAESVLDVMDTADANLPSEEADKVRQYINTLDAKLGRKPRDLSVISGRDWWLANGDSMRRAKFDLSEGSRSRQVLAAYQARKKRK